MTLCGSIKEHVPDEGSILGDEVILRKEYSQSLVKCNELFDNLITMFAQDIKTLPDNLQSLLQANKALGSACSDLEKVIAEFNSVVKAKSISLFQKEDLSEWAYQIIYQHDVLLKKMDHIVNDFFLSFNVNNKKSANLLKKIKRRQNLRKPWLLEKKEAWLKKKEKDRLICV